MKSFSLFVPILAATYTAAHGFLASVTIDGKLFNGTAPNDPPSDVQSVIRQVKTISPVKGASNPDLNCGASAVPSALIADANPGSKMDVFWSDVNAPWPHNTGPMLTYLTSCGSTPCSQFNSTTAQWFKIDQVGQKPDGTWFQADFMTGQSSTVTLPSTLAPGNYIMRHEIIALHLAVTLGGAEFYPSCTQLRVGGSQTGGPQPSELVSLPGAYKDNDPGIFDPNVFNPGATYTFPGPPIAAFANATSSSGSGPSTSNATSTYSGTTPSSTSSPSGPATTGTCKLKRAASPAAAIAVVRPRHISRVMRRLMSGSIH